MRRQKGFGGGLQQIHPRARDTLSSNREQRRNAFWGPEGAEMTANYFVPSFSIRRHLHRSEEFRWQQVQRGLGSVLGRHYQMMPTHVIAIKSIEQKALIQKIREAGSQPTSEDMRDAAYNIRDGLTEALAAAPDPLEIGLGRLAIFGRGRNKLGFEIAGWKGWRARYALLNEDREMTPQGALMVENQIALGSLAMAMSDVPFEVNEVASNPHLTIARTSRAIREQDVRKAQAYIDTLDLDRVAVGDPVIQFKANPRQEPELLFVRHSWDSLALAE